MVGFYNSPEKSVEIYQYPAFLTRFIMTDAAPSGFCHLLSICLNKIL